MRKIYIIAGHYNSDPGASGTHENIGRIFEAHLTKELRDMIASYFTMHNNNTIIKDDDSHTLTKVLNTINATIEKDDILIDIHFDAFNGKASGTSCFIPTVSSKIEKTIGANIAKGVSEILGVPNRGVRTEKQSARGRIGILHGTGNRILIEVCFIDNPSDIDSYLKNKHLVAQKIAELLE
jgi:N-acetylmuramoyl-L-alanine amidase